jgi:hypothetical protein
METNRHHYGHRDRIDDVSLPLPDMTGAEMLVFLDKIIQIAHCIRDKVTDYCWTTNQFHTRFYSTNVKRDRYFHILCFLHFTDNKNKPDMTDENSDRLWTVRNLFEILNKAFSKFYCPSDHLAASKFIILFKRRVIFRQYIPEKHKSFGIKIYRLCDETGYRYMTVYSLLDGGGGI